MTSTRVLHRAIGGSILTLAAAAVMLSAASGSAQGAGDTIKVKPGHSIQSALNRAHPGDTVVVAPGVYHENLTVLKSGITLRGAGSGPGGTVLVPGTHPHPSICTEFGEVNGICVTGYVDPKTRAPGKPIKNVKVTGFRVKSFSRYGILLYNGSNFRVAGNNISGNHRYGIAGYDISGVRYLQNAVHGNTGGGLQIGDSPKADAVIAGNKVYDNGSEGGIGLFLRDASHGVVKDNRVTGNCAGMILISTSPKPNLDWGVVSNSVKRNNGVCTAPEEGGPPLSGLGIGLLGTSHTVVKDNLVAGNRPGEDTPLVGGVLVASSKSLGGTASTFTQVKGNTVRGNAPADVIYDGSGAGNRFARNACGSSVPAAICH